MISQPESTLSYHSANVITPPSHFNNCLTTADSVDECLHMLLVHLCCGLSIRNSRRYSMCRWRCAVIMHSDSGLTPEKLNHPHSSSRSQFISVVNTDVRKMYLKKYCHIDWWSTALMKGRGIFAWHKDNVLSPVWTEMNHKTISSQLMYLQTPPPSHSH